MSNSGIHIATLRGWKAVAFLAVFFGTGLGFTIMARGELDEQGREVLEQAIAAEVMGRTMDDVAVWSDEAVASVLQAGEVRIASLNGRGPRGDMVVRVELEPGPHLPAGTERVRYYRMQHRMITGWAERGRATRLQWWLAFF